MKPLGGLHISIVLLALFNMLPTLEVEQSWGLFGFAVFAAIASLVWFAKSRGRPAPAWAVNLGVLLALAFLGWEMFGPADEESVHIIDLAHFVALLACCKFFECVSYRDAGLITVISFLLMSISALVSASLVFAVVLLIDLTYGIGWLIVFHASRQRDYIANRQRRIARLPKLSKPPQAPQDRIAGRGFVRTVFVNSLFMIVFASVVFVLMPRGLYGGIFGRMHNLVPSAMTGISDVVDLNETAIFEDPTPVMKVQFKRNDEVISDESFAPYMRAQTFSRYFNGEWRRTPTTSPKIVSRTKLDRPVALFPLPYPNDTRTIRQEIWLETQNNGAIYAMYPPVAIAFADSPIAKMDRRDFILETDSPRSETHYVVFSADPMFPELNDHLLSNSRGRPEGPSQISPAVVKFAREFVSNIGDPTDPYQHEQIASAIVDYFTSGEFEYTLRRGRRHANGDPIENFLFEDKRGHCEFFASTMALMCQAVDIQSRLVSGYMGGELNTAGDYYRFRQKDAHAWVEVLLPDRGWTTFDPTPLSADPNRAPDNSLWAKTTRFVDFLRFTWSTWIVSFDRESRRTLGEEFKNWLATFSQENRKPKSIGEIFTSFVFGPEGLNWWQRAGYWILLILILIFVILVLRVFVILSLIVRERLAGRSTTQARMARSPNARFYDRLLLLLANKGHVKPHAVTPREFALTLAHSNDELSDVPEFTEWFYEAQYGQRNLDPDREQRLSRFFKRLRENKSFGLPQSDRR